MIGIVLLFVFEIFCIGVFAYALNRSISLRSTYEGDN